MGAEIFLHSAWDSYCERLPLLKEQGRVDPMTKVDPMHLGRSLWHLASVVDSNAADEERMVGNLLRVRHRRRADGYAGE